ncbi:hypothetical protein Aca07nite_66850 [Actinoplanes capillaceus]|uniref:Protein N-acetyltransferase, RimJ/RimL family n=1 Tax=Actinoplanes campanulatus TaxID=113559 RepID=A0ABQ3WTB5_9ACTN|nr:hypothetical protein [Actinoplanes capillaceus]GID49410.1 hypothetical protein Aca07nite_66850 [Actinoplanes capillaceus]
MELRHDEFHAVPLTAALVELDYAAYMASPDVIRTHSDGRWPVDGFTLEQDIAQLTRHEADHRAGRAYTFALLDPAHTVVLGCLYLNPMRERLRDCFPEAAWMATFWIRQGHEDLTGAVVRAVHDWLLTECSAHVFRILPGEHASRVALAGLGLRERVLSPALEPRPYLWFTP